MITKVIVTGGRDFMEYFVLEKVLDQFPQISTVIQGGAKGADACARAYCEIKGKVSLTYPADWTQHGRAAGPIRNTKMLKDNPGVLVIAFPGGTGTKHCITEASKLGHDVLLTKVVDGDVYIVDLNGTTFEVIS